MILSLIVYTVVAVLLSFLGWQNNHYSLEFDSNSLCKSTSFNLKLCFPIMVFTIIAGVRYKTGWDYEFYLKEYDHLILTGEFYRQNYEPVFAIITRCFANLHLHFALYFAFWALLQAGCLYYALRKKTYLLPWIGLLIILGPFFLHWMNSIRQGVVECMLLAMTVLIEKRKFWWYFLFTLFAMTIHKSAILLLVFYGLAIAPCKISKKWIPLSIYTACFIIGLFPFLHAWVINLFKSIIDFFGYGVYVDLLNNNAHYSFGHNSFGLNSLILVLTHLAIILSYPKLKRYFKEDKFLQISFRLAFIYMCYFVFTINTSFYFKRPGEYLLPFYLTLSAYLLSYLWNIHKNKYFILFLFLSCSTTYLSLLKEFFVLKSVDSVIYYHFITF